MLIKTNSLDKSKQIYRTGFFDLKINSTMQFNKAISLTSNYGFVVEKQWWFVPAYTLENQINIGFQIPTKNSTESFYYSIALRLEYNLFPNDGKNKYIPGVALSYGIYFEVFLSRVVELVDLGVYYKIFISDHFALIPEIHFINRYLLDKNSWELSLSLRKYF